MYKAVLFDLDNTLLDFKFMKESAIDASIKAIQDEVDIDFNDAKLKILNILNKTHWEYDLIFQEFLKEFNEENNIRVIAKAVSAYRKSKIANLKTFPKVKVILTDLIRKGVKLGIVTDATSLKAWNRLVETGLENYFDIVVTYDDTCELKPSKKPFEFAQNLLKLNSDEILFVGDTPSRDICGAKNVGFKTAFAYYGYNESLFKNYNSELNLNKILEEFEPDFVLHKFEDISKLFLT